MRNLQLKNPGPQPPINAFQGKHIRGNTARLAQLKRREKRLKRLALSVMAFVPHAGIFWPAYFKNRNDERIAKRIPAKKKRAARKPKAA